MKRRSTKQRDTVYEYLYKLGHASADQVYQAINLDQPGFSLATVYRNLNVLADEGRINRIQQGAQSNYFDVTIDSHYHFICTECHKIEDIHLDYMEHLNDDIKSKHNVDITNHQIVFHGVCSECQENEI